jgi:hypothetical protein
MPEIEDIEELISQCLPGWSEGSSEAIRDQFNWEELRAGLVEIIGKIQDGTYEKERIGGILLENAKERARVEE